MAIELSKASPDKIELLNPIDEPLTLRSLLPEDEGEFSLRPQLLREFVGQE